MGPTLLPGESGHIREVVAYEIEQGQGWQKCPNGELERFGGMYGTHPNSLFKDLHLHSVQMSWEILVMSISFLSILIAKRA